MPAIEFQFIEKELILLRHLLAGETYCFAIARRISIASSTIKYTLREMERKGLVASRLFKPPGSISNRPLRMYDITDLGRKELVRWEDQLLLEDRLIQR